MKKKKYQTDGYHLDTLRCKLSSESTTFEFMRERKVLLKYQKVEPNTCQHMLFYILLEFDVQY